MSENSERNTFAANGNFIYLTAMAAIVVMVLAIGGIGIASVSGGGIGTSVSDTSTVEVTLTEFGISMQPSAVPSGNVILSIHNAGSMDHNIAAVSLNKRTPTIPTGAHISLALGKITSPIEIICEIPGHKDSGMKATLSIGVLDPTTESVPVMTNAQMDKVMEDVALKFPAKTSGTGNQDLAPIVSADGFKEFTLVAKVIDWEVEPGKIVQGWSYNGQIPGPVLRANVGDKVRIIVKNELSESTSMHLHGIRVPNSMDGVDPLTQKPILPGESFSYEFTAREPAVGMYHSHHNAQVQIPNGLAGAIIIGDWKSMAMKAAGNRIKDANGKAEQEVFMVLNDAGTIGLALNGKSFPATTPYVMKLGESMVVHYYNEGLMSHPMHMHQPSGLVVAIDGRVLETPYFSDTIPVAPGQRITVVYTASDPGVWAWHCHILTHAETPMGMKYMVTAVIVK